MYRKSFCVKGVLYSLTRLWPSLVEVSFWGRPTRRKIFGGVLSTILIFFLFSKTHVLLYSSSRRAAKAFRRTTCIRFFSFSKFFSFEVLLVRSFPAAYADQSSEKDAEYTQIMFRATVYLCPINKAAELPCFDFCPLILAEDACRSPYDSPERSADLWALCLRANQWFRTNRCQTTEFFLFEQFLSCSCCSLVLSCRFIIK